MSAAFAQDTADAAKGQWRKVADQVRPGLPKLAGLLDEAETDVLAYMAFPPPIAPSCIRPTRWRALSNQTYLTPAFRHS